MARRTITIDGLNQLVDKSSNPTEVKRAITDGMADEIRTGLIVAREAVRGGTGRAVNSMLGNVYSNFTADIKSAMNRKTSVSIDRGRKAGFDIWPDVAAISRWARAVGYKGGVHDPNDKGLYVGLATKMSERGTKGKGFKKATNDKVRSHLPITLDKIKERVIRWFG